MPTIEYYFSSISPFTYLGHKAFEDVAHRHGCPIAYKPVDLPAVFAVSGALPVPKRPAVRQRYRLLELKRIAAYRKLPINVKPAHFPVDATLADQCTIALLAAKIDPSDFIWRVLSGVWANEENIAEETTLSSYLSALGHDAAAIIEYARSDDAASIRAQNTKDAIAADACGVPAYVLNGEVFWGQDRIDLLDHALEAGRAPLRPE